MLGEKSAELVVGFGNMQISIFDEVEGPLIVSILL